MSSFSVLQVTMYMIRESELQPTLRSNPMETYEQALTFVFQKELMESDCVGTCPLKQIY